MKLSRAIYGSFGLFLASSLVGCGDFGGVQFDYVLLQNDGAGGIVAAPDCASAGVADVRFSIGFDNNADGILDDAESVEQITQGCNQSDDNGDGIVDANEIGLFQTGDADIIADNYEAFAIEFLDAGGTPLLWEPFDQETAAQKFTFKGNNGTEVGGFVLTDINFLGDGEQVADELQVFFGF